MELERLCNGGGSVPVAEALNSMFQTVLVAEKFLCWLLFLIGSIPKNADPLADLLEAEKRFPFSDLKNVSSPDDECKDNSDTEGDSDEDEDAAAGNDSDNDDDAEDSSGEDNDDEVNPDSDSDANDEDDDDDDDDDDEDDDDDDDDDEDDEDDDEDEEEENQPPFKKKK